MVVAFQNFNVITKYLFIYLKNNPYAEDINFPDKNSKYRVVNPDIKIQDSDT